MFEQDHAEENEQQKLDEAQGGQDDSFEEDSDYFSFDRVRDRALGSEYGEDLSRGDTMDDTGTYKFDTGDNEMNLEEVFRRKEKVYTYSYLRDVINGMEPDNVFPNLEDLEQSKLMQNIRRRMGSGGVFLGIDFVKDGTSTPFRIIVRKRDPITKRLTDGFEYSGAGKSGTAIKIFRDRLEEARKKYRDRPSGVIEDEIRSELSDDDASSEGSRETVQENIGEDGDDQGPLGDASARGNEVVRYNTGSEEVTIERQQENRELASVIDEEVEKTKFELIEEVEDDLQGVRDKLMARFTKLDRDNEITPFGEQNYLDHIEDLLNPISNMRFFKNQEFFTDTDMTADQLYDQQMKYLEDNIKDIDKRVAKEKAKGERANEELLKAYKGLNDCIDLKMDTLNLYFERPVEGEYFRRQVRRLVRRNGRLAFERGKRWIKAKFPEFLAGITVSIGTIVFSIYELAENMGRGIVEQGQKALKNLGKKIKELAAQQGGAIGTMLHVVGSLLEHGAEGLNVLRDHFIAVSIIIILLITGGYYYFKGRLPRGTRPKVRVKRKHKD